MLQYHPLFLRLQLDLQYGKLSEPPKRARSRCWHLHPESCAVSSRSDCRTPHGAARSMLTAAAAIAQLKRHILDLRRSISVSKPQVSRRHSTEICAANSTDFALILRKVACRAERVLYAPRTLPARRECCSLSQSSRTEAPTAQSARRVSYLWHLMNQFESRVLH